jgi:hypothetical protein
MATARGGFPPFVNELRRLGGELLMAARYPALGPYRVEIEQMAQRVLQIVDELMAQSVVNPQIGLPPTPEAQAMPPGGVPGEIPVGAAAPPSASEEAAVAQILQALGGAV